MNTILETQGLSKTFVFGLRRRRVEAVRDLTLKVLPGEVFGFVGPNGAGKTTTIKMLMGLIFPSSGTCRVLGRPVPHLEAQRRLGFLPENPYFYDYLTGAELLDLAGRLFDLPRPFRQRRAEELLVRLGLEKAASLPLRKYSKGMLQRIGLAQALINDPELVVLDEPMSGLDPIGRKEFRDFIGGLRQEGKTVFFSTHILSDVELICDRCAILVSGRLRDVGPLDRLLSPRLLDTEIVLAHEGVTQALHLPPDENVDAFLAAAIGQGAKIVSVIPRRETLEDLFLREVQAESPQAPAEHDVAAAEVRP